MEELKNSNFDMGFETLRTISKADRFNGWMYETIEPWCIGNILEIGSGIGNISSLFLFDSKDITVSDIQGEYLSILKDKFKHMNTFGGAELIDISLDDFAIKYKHMLGTFNTVFALNIIEHVKDDERAIENCRKLLKPNGKLIILVPAYQKLFNNFDKELSHFRRYRISNVNSLLKRNGFEILHSQYFNFIGIFGWWFFGSILKKKEIPSNQMKIYNSLVPVFKIIDKLVLNKIGLSVISVAKNNS